MCFTWISLCRDRRGPHGISAFAPGQCHPEAALGSGAASAFSPTGRASTGATDAPNNEGFGLNGSIASESGQECPALGTARHQ